MAFPTAQPGTRFLRVARTLALVSGIATPAIFAVAGCSSSSSENTTSDAGDDGAYDGRVFGVYPDTGYDGLVTGTDTADTADSPFDGVVTGVAPLDTGVDADGGPSDAAADTEGGLPGGPGRAPEMPEEALA